MKLDVLLINPGSRRDVYQGLGDEFSAIEPPSLAALFATYLRKRGQSVEIIDAPASGLTPTEVAEAVNATRATLNVLVVYGFQPSASTQNMTAAGQTASCIKQLWPEAKIMMTGTHPAALPERTLRDEDVDYVCSGEGPRTIAMVALALKSGRKSMAGTNVPALWYWVGDAIMHTPSDLMDEATLNAEMPGAAWDLLPMQKYRAHNWHCFEHIDDRQPYASIHTSLGCPYHCGFCCINAPFGGSSYRMWSPELVAAEIDTLYHEHGVRNIKFVDEMFVLNKRHVHGVCDALIASGVADKLNIWAYARVDTVKDEFLGKLREAGVRWLALGIESASKHVRDGMEKGRFGNEEILKTVRKVQGAGINVIGNYIFGLPDDTMDSMRETLSLAIEAKCEFANFYSAMAYPGSALYGDAKKRGWALPDSPGGPGWIGYSQHAFETLPLPTEALTAAEVLGFRDAAFRAYYISPSYRFMVKDRFGAKVDEHIGRMVDQPLPGRSLVRSLRLPDQAAADALQKRLTGKDAAPKSATPSAAAPPSRKRRTPSSAYNYSGELARQIRMASLPSPILEYPFAKPERDYRADLAYPDRHLLIEVDGAVHRIKERFSADLLRDQVIFFLNWRKLRVSPAQVRNGEALRLVERALAL